MLAHHACQPVVNEFHPLGAKLVVDKRETRGRSEAEARPVEGEARVVELARMLSGLSGSGSARRHAEELLDGARAVAS